MVTATYLLISGPVCILQSATFKGQPAKLFTVIT